MNPQYIEVDALVRVTLPRSSGRSVRLWLTTLSVVVGLVSLIGCSAEPPRPSEPEKPKSPEFRDLDGRAHTPLAQPGRKATVLFFLLTDCPISNAYAPEIGRICTEYADKQVSSFVVHADPDVTTDAAKKHAQEYRLPCPVLIDPTHVLVHHSGAKMAPEAVVLGPDSKVLYRGRIDDWYVDYGKRRAEPTKRDLRDALDAVLRGDPVATPTTTAIGCFLPDPKK